MSKNTKLRTRIAAILLAFVMAAGLFVTGINATLTAKADTTGSTTFIFVGDGYVNDDAAFWITYAKIDGVEIGNDFGTGSKAWDAGLGEAWTYTDDGYRSVTISGDTTKYQSIYMNVWNGVKDINTACTLENNVLYVYDDVISADAPEVEPEPEPEPKIGRTTFVYAGSGAYTAKDIEFYATEICVNGSNSSIDAEIRKLDSSYTVEVEETEYNGRPAIVISANTNVCTTLRANMYMAGSWETGNEIKKNENTITFDDTVYYIYDDSFITTTPPSEDTPEVEYVTYTATIHVYGQDATVGGWLFYSENGTETAWGTDKQASGTLSGDWSTVTLSYTYAEGTTYSGIGVQLIDGTEWLPTQYKLSFNGTSCEMWIVPEAGSCFDNEADALAAAAEPATSSTIIVHYKHDCIAAWVIGTWYTSAINGDWGSKDTKFTYQDDWGYVAVVNYSDVLNEIGFKCHQVARLDGVMNTWYREDGENRTISLSNGFAEVWITKGNSEVLYECPDGATKFDLSKAKAFRNYNYVFYDTPKGEDAELVFHYLREDGVYDEWTVGIWAEVTSGNWKDAQITQNAELDEYGAATYTVNLADWPKKEIGFAVNYNNWESKDYEADRYVDVSNVKAGDVLDVYLYENDGNIYYEPKTGAVSETDAAGIDADVVFHYSRTNADYEGWMVGLWCEKADGEWVNDNVAFDGTDADGFATVTVELSKFPADILGFKINKDNWASEDGGDRSLDLTEITDGQILDVYIYEGDDEVYFELQVEEEPVVEDIVSETDVVAEEPAEETKGGCAGCTGSAVLLPVFAAIIAGALFIFRKRA